MAKLGQQITFSNDGWESWSWKLEILGNVNKDMTNMLGLGRGNVGLGFFGLVLVLFVYLFVCLVSCWFTLAQSLAFHDKIFQERESQGCDADLYQVREAAPAQDKEFTGGSWHCGKPQRIQPATSWVEHCSVTLRQWWHHPGAQRFSFWGWFCPAGIAEWRSWLGWFLWIKLRVCGRRSGIPGAATCTVVSSAQFEPAGSYKQREN